MEEPKNITIADEAKGAGAKRKPRTKKDGNTDQRSLKNQKNMSHARSELQKYIHAGKAEKIKTKKEVATEVEEEEEEEDIEIIFKSPKVKQPENKTEEKENKKSKVKELEDLIGRYHSELSRISEKNKKLKKQKKKVSTTPPPPSPTPLPYGDLRLPPHPTPYSSIGNDLRKKFLLRF